MRGADRIPIERWLGFLLVGFPHYSSSPDEMQNTRPYSMKRWSQQGNIEVHFPQCRPVLDQCGYSDRLKELVVSEDTSLSPSSILILPYDKCKYKADHTRCDNMLINETIRKYGRAIDRQTDKGVGMYGNYWNDPLGHVYSKHLSPHQILSKSYPPFPLRVLYITKVCVKIVPPKEGLFFSITACSANKGRRERLLWKMQTMNV